ncbi:hypothetical protein PIB30_083985, partial [Stylosanthes scabra]|nr:hypothetical protein [Stylosanthes scabra]
WEEELGPIRVRSGKTTRMKTLESDDELGIIKIHTIFPMAVSRHVENRDVTSHDSCIGLLPAPDVNRNKSEYGFFNQRCASWLYHVIPHLLNVGGTTPPSPTLRHTDQAGRTTILVRHKTLLTSYRSKEETSSHTYFGERPLSSMHTKVQAGYDLRPYSNACFLVSYVTGPLDRRLA